MKDGSMLVSDDHNGAIYRITYRLIKYETRFIINSKFMNINVESNKNDFLQSSYKKKNKKD